MIRDANPKGVEAVLSPRKHTAQPHRRLFFFLFLSLSSAQYDGSFLFPLFRVPVAFFGDRAGLLAVSRAALCQSYLQLICDMLLTGVLCVYVPVVSTHSCLMC